MKIVSLIRDLEKIPLYHASPTYQRKVIALLNLHDCESFLKLSYNRRQVILRDVLQGIGYKYWNVSFFHLSLVSTAMSIIWPLVASSKFSNLSGLFVSFIQVGLLILSGILIRCYSKLKREQNECEAKTCLLYTSPSPRDLSTSRMPSSA